VWFTGLSGSGKSTLANGLEAYLNDKGVMCFLLDGDILRQGLCSDLGYSLEDRKENIRRVSEVSRLFAMSGVVALAVMAGQGGPQWPQTSLGWGGLAALTFLYGTAFTIMFTVLPKLGVSGHSAIMNVEPVFALVLAWAVLGQHIAPIQILGAVLVVGAVMALGLRKA
jgi:drug/metabolite transporter (DMT)-like permease